MAGKNKKPKNQEDPNERVVTRNRKARHEYEVLDEVNCGMVLLGSEVKSVRNSKIQIEFFNITQTFCAFYQRL